MLIHGSPLSVSFPQDAADADRFWYWRGASGRKYIHSVYGWGQCPPLPGAIYLAVKRIGHLRTVVAINRFAPIWDGRFTCFEHLDADEIHVHLLARDNRNAEAILKDLQTAFADSSPDHMPPGFHEAAQMPSWAA